MIPALIAGAAALIGTGISAASQSDANSQNVSAQERINEANLEHANYWNEKNYGLASETQQAQLAQQDWANEQYVEQRDYNRQLQQEIFHREDTALQRSLQQATDAGFSPLTALGINTGAGSIVSSSSAPGSMVSNNQASVQGAGQVAPRVESLTSGDGFSQLGVMLATMAENQSMRDHQKEMQSAEFAQKLVEMDKGHFADTVLKKMEHDFLANRDNQQHLYTIAEKLQDEVIQKRILSIIHGQESQMQKTQHGHELYMQGRQHVFESSNDANRSGRGLHDVFDDLIDVLAKGDGKFATWLRNNKDVLTLIIEGVEIAGGYYSDHKDKQPSTYKGKSTTPTPKKK